MIQNIPFELQRLDQWVCAGPDKIPLNPRTGQRADPVDMTTWGTFEEACRCGYKHIGFVLSKTDPYCIIDLDDPDTPEQAQRHSAIVNAFDTYTELSQSGKGLHIVARGSLPRGVRRDKVEIYSSERYMIFTGNIFKALPIVDYQALINQMFQQMDSVNPSAELVQIDSHLSDEEVYNMAASAVNSAKFIQLWNGEWSGVPEWPSQSEADFALLSIIAFYTKDNEQVRRLFRYSALGKRKKANVNDKYLNFALGKIRAKELPMVDFSALTERTKDALTRMQVSDRQTGTVVEQAGIGGGEVEQRATGVGGTVEGVATEKESLDREDNAGDAGTGGFEYPEGFVGRVAQYIYSSAIRPVPEIGLAAGIALCAGVAGRTYNISGTGLNQYLVMLAKTGSGKEGAATGIDALVQAVRMQCPMVDQFIGPGAFASGQALIRVLDKQQCFVSVLGEFGFTLQQLSDPKASSAHVILKKVLLDIYAKSGFSKVLRSSVYSEAEKNTKVIQAPNVTILGEATPESFYDGLDISAIAQGLIPRFSIFEYEGERPERNPHAFAPPPKSLVDEFATLLAVAMAAEQNRANCPVQVDRDAQSIFDQFDAEADARMRGAGQDIVLQLWNRAHLKALKLGALIAVGKNPHQPVIAKGDAEWASKLVTRDITKLLGRFSSGDVGQVDMRLEADMKRAVADYLRMKPKKKAEYGAAESIRGHDVVPVGFLRRRLRGLASYRSDRRGANAALQATVKALMDAGELIQVNPMQAKEQFGVSTPLYAVGENWNK